MSASPIRLLGIETSCDETAIGVVEDGRRILSNVVASSVEFHRAYGGVIPEIASRVHVETIWQVLDRALEEAHVGPEAIDAIAVTRGPGLPGALVIGLAFAKGLALGLDRPLVPVDHLAAHLYAGEMSARESAPPYVGLIVSGGHTVLCVTHPDYRFELLGETKDDAVGEAFDKVAKLLHLGYPGGPVIDRLSDEGRAQAVAFPRGHTKQPFDFSFSGLKTAVYNYVQRTSAGHNPLGRVTPEGRPLPPARTPTVLLRFCAAKRSSGGRTDGGVPQAAGPAPLGSQQIADIAASFQEAAVDILVTKTLRACQRTGLTRIVVGGGVASNRRLRTRLAEEAAAKKLEVVFPPPALCVDNGAMVAGMGYPLLKQGRVAPLSVAADPNLCLA